MDLAADRRSVETLTREVEGWLTPAEGLALYELARSVRPPAVIVEIGSWKGKSTIWLARGARAGLAARVIAIDPHTGSGGVEERQRQQPEGGAIWSYDAFLENVRRAGVADLVQPILALSHEAASGFGQPVGLLFIDGEHTYEAVRNDLTSWLPKLELHGVIAFHDSNLNVYPGVSRAVKESVFLSTDFADIGYADSLTWARRVAANTIIERMRNRCALVLRYPDDFAARLHWRILPRPLRRLARWLLDLVRKGRNPDRLDA